MRKGIKMGKKGGTIFIIPIVCTFLLLFDDIMTTRFAVIKRRVDVQTTIDCVALILLQS